MFQNMAVLQSGENHFMVETQLMRFIKLPLSSCSVRNSGFLYLFLVCKPEFDFLVLHFKKKTLNLFSRFHILAFQCFICTT